MLRPFIKQINCDSQKQPEAARSNRNQPEADSITIPFIKTSISSYFCFGIGSPPRMAASYQRLIPGRHCQVRGGAIPTPSRSPSSLRIRVPHRREEQQAPTGKRIVRGIPPSVAWPMGLSPSPQWLRLRHPRLVLWFLEYAHPWAALPGARRCHSHPLALPLQQHSSDFKIQCRIYDPLCVEFQHTAAKILGNALNPKRE